MLLQKPSYYLIFLLLICLDSYGQVPPAPSPTPAEIKAYEDGLAAGAAIGDSVSDKVLSGLTTQDTSYNTLQKSAVDSMMNSQKGEASAILMSEALTTSASPYVSSCDPDSLEGISACATGSVLAGMSGQMDLSVPTYKTPINLAWNNACYFSSLGCGPLPIPSPFDPIVKKPAETLPPQTLPEIVETLKDKGYVVDLRTGIVTFKDGTKVDVNNKKSVAKALGESANKSLLDLLSSIQNDITRRLAKVSVRDYMKLLGFKGAKDLGNQKVTDQVNGNNDQALSEHRGGHYNRLPEKVREKIELSELVKNYRGTPIGVASADIFKMIKKRYNIKSSQKIFLPTEEQTYRQSSLDN